MKKFEAAADNWRHDPADSNASAIGSPTRNPEDSMARWRFTRSMRKSKEARNTGGFSLDDASRAYRDSFDGEPVKCPECSVTMQRVEGDEHSEPLWILRCEVCGRGVVLRRSSKTSRIP